MLGTIHLGLFLISGIGLNLYPGPDTLYIISRSLTQGRKAGIVSVFGITSGSIVHTIAAGLGVSAIVAASSHALLGIKIIGALYLLYLGIRTMALTDNDPGADTYLSTLSNFQIYRQGFLTNLLNPKVALFFLSFLPQFIDPVHNQGFITFFFLGAIFMTTGTIWGLIVAVCAAQMADRLRKNPRAVMVMEKITGLIFIVIGCYLLI